VTSDNSRKQDEDRANFAGPKFINIWRVEDIFEYLLKKIADTKSHEYD
jgi:hypothetical protein